MKKKGWSRNDKLVVLGLLLALVIGVSAFFVPEVGRRPGLDKEQPESTRVSVPEPAPPKNSPPTSVQAAGKTPKETTTQWSRTKVVGTDNVAYNNVAGKQQCRRQQ